MMMIIYIRLIVYAIFRQMPERDNNKIQLILQYPSLYNYLIIT